MTQQKEARTEICEFEMLARACEDMPSSSYALECEIERVAGRKRIVPLNYTLSSHSAQDLIPDGAGWNLQGNKGVFYAVVAGHYSKACINPALALSAAALRARAALAKTGGDA